jgi:hypothetical protein
MLGFMNSFTITSAIASIDDQDYQCLDPGS